MRITAIVICHKLEHLVDRAVASLTTQTRTPDRIVILGTDCRHQTRSAANRWRDHHPGIQTHFSDTPLSCVDSKILAASLVDDGAFFTLDADDFLLPLFVERTASMIEYGDHDVAGSDYFIVNTNGTTHPAAINSLPIERLYEYNVLPSCSMMKKDSYKKVGGYSTSVILEDWELWCRMKSMGMSLCRYPQPLLCHVRHASNITLSLNMERGRQQIRDMYGRGNRVQVDGGVQADRDEAAGR